MHVLKRTYEINNKYCHQSNTEYMIPITVMTLNEIHKRREEAIEEDRDYRREPNTRKKTRISRKMHRERCIVPIVYSAEFFYRESQKDFSYGDDEETCNKERP